MLVLIFCRGCWGKIICGILCVEKYGLGIKKNIIFWRLIKLLEKIGIFVKLVLGGIYLFVMNNKIGLYLKIGK